MHTKIDYLEYVKVTTAVLGDKWTPLLLRCFINEKEVRFCQLQSFVGGINPRTLSARLDYLEQSAIITKVVRKGGGHCTYRLTKKGDDLLPILKNMQIWGQKYSQKQGENS